MAKIYARVTKLKSISGRYSYINNSAKQEDIILSKDNFDYDWAYYDQYELANKKSNESNNSGREIVIALPNELNFDREKLEKTCDDLASGLTTTNDINFKRDYSYAVHWNHTRTNLHMHLIFSERSHTKEVQPKIYKRDMWYDKKTNKMTKAKEPGAELRYKKGDIQKDKLGNIKYKDSKLSAKDKKYIQLSFNKERDLIIKKTLKKHGFDIDIQNKETPYLSQKKLYKGASHDYLEKAKKWNNEVTEYNKVVKEHIKIEPVQIEKYKEIKKEIEFTVRDFNSISKKITEQAIELIKEMGDWVKQTVKTIRNYIVRKDVEYDISKKMNEFTDEFKKVFEQQEKTFEEMKEIDNQLDKVEAIENQYERLINNKKDYIEKIQNEINYEREMNNDFSR